MVTIGNTIMVAPTTQDSNPCSTYTDGPYISNATNQQMTIIIYVNIGMIHQDHLPAQRSITRIYLIREIVKSYGQVFTGRHL